MDVSKWNFDKVMQLPDWCFGRQWPILSTNIVAPTAKKQWMVNKGVPNKMVLWEIRVFGSMGDITTSWYKLAIGPHKPASSAEFDTFERLFTGDMDLPEEESAIPVAKYQSTVIPMRRPIAMNGKRFCIQMENNHASVGMRLCFVFTISSIPKEVPDWLFSGQAGLRL